MPQAEDKLLIFEEFLKKKRLRKSKQRNVIMEEFFRTDHHISVEELLENSRLHDPKVGFATVYRTLKLLVDAGLAHERDFNTGRKLYENAEPGQTHDHLVCLNCGSVTEFHSAEIKAAQKAIAQQQNFDIVRYRHEMYGFCQSCSRGDSD